MQGDDGDAWCKPCSFAESFLTLIVFCYIQSKHSLSFDKTFLTLIVFCYIQSKHSFSFAWFFIVVATTIQVLCIVVFVLLRGPGRKCAAN